LPPPRGIVRVLMADADTEAAPLILEPSVVEEQFVVAVGVFAIAPPAIDPHREQVDRVTVPVRGKVDRSFIERPILVAPVIVDPARDVETVEAVTAFDATVVPVEPVLAILTPFVPIKTLMPVVDSVPAVMTTVRLGGHGEGQRERERNGGNGDLGDAFHGKASFNAPVYCQNRANRLSMMSH